MKSLQGQLLVASPTMKDARFNRAVILVLHHDNNGAMGVVLNRPMARRGNHPRLGDVLFTPRKRFHAGGPVSGPLIVLHGLHDDEEDQTSPGKVFVIEKKEQLEALLANSEEDFRFYVGHTGWTSGQLESEIEAGSWLTVAAPTDFAFGDEQQMWIDAMREAGRAFYRDVLDIHDFPISPLHN